MAKIASLNFCQIVCNPNATHANSRIVYSPMPAHANWKSSNHQRSRQESGEQSGQSPQASPLAVSSWHKRGLVSSAVARNERRTVIFSAHHFTSQARHLAVAIKPVRAKTAARVTGRSGNGGAMAGISITRSQSRGMISPQGMEKKPCAGDAPVRLTRLESGSADNDWCWKSRGYYGWRRPYYGYGHFGWRRPYYGYGNPGGEMLRAGFQMKDRCAGVTSCASFSRSVIDVVRPWGGPKRCPVGSARPNAETKS